MNKQTNKLIELYGTAKEWYDSHSTTRESLEQGWKDSAQLTMPYIFPASDYQDESSIMPTPYNSIGPAAVNTLAGKLLLALLPPTGGFFRLLPDKNKIPQEILSNPDSLKQLDAELSQVERDVIEYINKKAMRVPVYEAIKLLIITGNVMLYKIPNGSFKVFSPYQYVVSRDYVGNIISMCIKESMEFASLPANIQELLKEQETNEMASTETTKEEQLERVDIYTIVHRKNKKTYTTWQEINGIVLPDTDKEYSTEELPYIVLRWTTVNNEDYGRGIVSQYLGDFRSLEGLTQTITEGAGISARYLFGLRPGSTLKVEDLNNAENGQFVLGDLEREVSVLQVNKGADLQVPLALMQQLEQRLEKAFLMLGGQIRDSERTTATEVRAVASELESTLGGVFSVLAAEFQTPMLKLILKELQPKALKIAQPSITTGVSAISRERDYQNLNTMLQAIAQLGPDVIQMYLNIPSYLSQIATSLGMNPDEIVKTPEQIQQEQQRQQEMQLQQQNQEVQGKMAVDNNKQQGGNTA